MFKKTSWDPPRKRLRLGINSTGSSYMHIKLKKHSHLNLLSLSPAPSSVAEAASLDRRCGSMQVTCDNSNEARRKNCNLLVDQLVGDRTPLQSSQRSICLEFNGSRCCVSWHDSVQGAVWENLVPAARAGLDKCRGDTGVSAKAKDTLLGATCTDQCLSDRPEWC